MKTAVLIQNQNLAKRNIELSKEISILKDEINRISFNKDMEYKKLWQQNQELQNKLNMINKFTQSLPMGVA